jgi:hypothetical protein
VWPEACPVGLTGWMDGRYPNIPKPKPLPWEEPVELVVYTVS